MKAMLAQWGRRRGLRGKPEPPAAQKWKPPGLQTVGSKPSRFIGIQTAEVNAVKRLLRRIGQTSGPRGSLRTDAHRQRLLAGVVVPERFKEHVRHRYALGMVLRLARLYRADDDRT
ncbi:MAG TPA: hypothetical protein VJ718_04110 [Candidatus Binataceae bacterium]|nr:hypothetical protein [Candidatus Binataceae bacterium]